MASFSPAGYSGIKLQKQEIANSVTALDSFDLPTVTVLPPPSESKLVYKNPDNIPYFSDGSNWRSVTALKSTSTSVGITDADTALHYFTLTPVSGSLTVPANTLVPGSIIESEAEFSVVAGTNIGVCTLRVNLGAGYTGSINFTMQAGSFLGKLTVKSFITSIGATGAANGYSQLYFSNNINGMVVLAASVVNTTIDNAFQVGVTFASATSSATITLASLKTLVY